MQFTWDSNKNAANIRKHGVDFADVPAMFERPTLQAPDTRNEYGEDRWIALGFLTIHTIAVVAYVEKSEDTIRIISARKATRREIEGFERRLGNIE